ncbi:MAG: hypothetical protein ACK4NA_14675 [Alphaproteobacteria bacterium]
MRVCWETDIAWRQALAGSAVALTVAIGVALASDRGVSSTQNGQEQFATRGAEEIESLSPGNRLIAEALFAAQAPDAQGRASWSLTKIAAERGAGQNWGDVFHRMKSENLLRADTLGQVVTWYQYNYLKPEPYMSFGGAAIPASGKSYGN